MDLKFIIIKKQDINKDSIKAKGLSLQAYFTKYKEYPFLNDTNEVNYAIKGFEKNLDEY
ncbi:hypothetical protein N9O22_01050 [Gammaproteobacteria bacterium]|nr:hypothetical protein [Gammaproteobacteria bacterium]